MSQTSEFAVSVDDRGHCSDLTDDVQIIGNPLHASKKTLIQLYTESRARYLEHESRYSCGDYLLVDAQDELRIVTSLGYVGGYFYRGSNETYISTKLSTALKRIQDDELQLDPNVLVYYLFMSPWFKLPFSTMFSDTYRLPPGVCLELSDKPNLTSYLSEKNPPESYSEVMKEVIGTLADAEVVVSLSGGVDSVSLACACAQHDVSARAVTFDIGPGQTNDVNRGEKVASELGMDHEVIPLDRPTRGGLADAMEASMREDLFLLTNERVGFLALDRANETEVGISGMGPDPLAHRRMYPGPLVYDRRRYLHPKYLADEVFNRLGHRMLHTDTYLGRPTFRKAYLEIAGRLYPLLNRFDDRIDARMFGVEGVEVLADRSMKSVLKGQISTEVPNLVWTVPDQLAVTQRKEGVSLDVFEKDSLFRDQFDTSFLDREIDEFAEVLGDDLRNIKNPIERLLFYAFCQNTQKSMSNFKEDYIPLRGPICWGPSVSYFLNKDHQLITRDGNKQEIMDYVDRQLGTSYEELVANIPERDWSTPRESELVDRHRHRLSVDDSLVLSHTPESELLQSIYSDIHDLATENQMRNKQQNRFMNKVINLELLLESVTVGH